MPKFSALLSRSIAIVLCSLVEYNQILAYAGPLHSFRAVGRVLPSPVFNPAAKGATQRGGVGMTCMHDVQQQGTPDSALAMFPVE